MFFSAMSSIGFILASQALTIIDLTILVLWGAFECMRLFYAVLSPCDSQAVRNRDLTFLDIVHRLFLSSDTCHMSGVR